MYMCMYVCMCICVCPSPEFILHIKNGLCLVHGQIFYKFNISNMIVSILLILVLDHLFSRYINPSHHAKADINFCIHRTY